jgi:hypothetical protein
MSLPALAPGHAPAVGLGPAACVISSVGSLTSRACSGLLRAVSEFRFGDTIIDNRPLMREEFGLLFALRPTPIHEGEVRLDVVVLVPLIFIAFKSRAALRSIVLSSFASSDPEEIVGSFSVVSSLELALISDFTLTWTGYGAGGWES